MWRLVIEHVTADCQSLGVLASGIRLDASPSFSQAGVSLSFNPEFFLPFPNNPVGGEQVLSQETRIYVDPGVTVAMNALAFVNSGVCSYSAYGHFVVQ